jgi:hypothetical protein
MNQGGRAMTKSLKAKVFTAAAVGLMLFSVGCKNENRLIDRVTFKPSDNLEVVRVSLVFTPNVKSDLAGALALKEYGYLFVNPYTPDQPFEVGFDLNTSIVNDQDYVRLTPTDVLPNGVPIGIGHTIVEVRGANPIHPKFDLFGYVDVLRTSWLGIAAMFGFLDDKFFPSGLTITQVFKRDDQGRPRILASVFGPTLNEDGSLRRAGGIALFVNVRGLITGGAFETGKELTFQAEPIPYLSGPSAELYEGKFGALRRIETNLIRGLNLVQ